MMSPSRSATATVVSSAGEPASTDAMMSSISFTSSSSVALNFRRRSAVSAGSVGLSCAGRRYMAFMAAMRRAKLSVGITGLLISFRLGYCETGRYDMAAAASRDEAPTAARVRDPGIRALYQLENRWQSWLDVEAALARAQAELGIIPKEAAEAITRSAKFELLDRARIQEGFARTGHTIVPLVWELSRVVGEPHGGWVHWSATTQNITQTGDLVVLRQAHAIFLKLIGETLTSMADLAERGAEMAMPGRTHGQHAVPATFGFKVAGWIDELLRHVERMKQAAPRIFVAMLGGGAGTYASFGADGQQVAAGMAKELDMQPMA